MYCIYLRIRVGSEVGVGPGITVPDAGTMFTPVAVGVGAGRATERVARKPTAMRKPLNFMVVGSFWLLC